MAMVGLIDFECVKCKKSKVLHNRYNKTWCPVCKIEYNKIDKGKYEPKSIIKDIFKLIIRKFKK